MTAHVAKHVKIHRKNHRYGVSLKGYKFEGLVLNHPREQGNNFNSVCYLTDFYSKVDNDAAMHIVLFYLPGIAARLPSAKTLLDVGSGPTVHVPMIFRNKVEKIYLSDYSDNNLEILHRWWKGNQTFDWSEVAKFIAKMEVNDDNWETMEDLGRDVVHGVYHCDVYRKGVIEDKQKVAEGFDVVTSFFCVEASGVTSDDYQKAMKNVLSLIKPGGHLVMGGIQEDNWYKFSGRCFQCHYLTEQELFRALKRGGMDLEDGRDRFILVVIVEVVK